VLGAAQLGGGAQAAVSGARAARAGLNLSRFFASCARSL